MNYAHNLGADRRCAQTINGVLEHPRYSPGLILEDSDLTSAINYTRDLSRLLLSSLFGCGVVCGLRVSVKEDCGIQVTVDPGLALDGCGNPIQVTKPVTISLDKSDFQFSGDVPARKNFWVVLCGKEKFCAPRSIVCDDEDVDGTSQMTRVRAQAEISIAFDEPKCLCQKTKTDTGLSDEKRADGLIGVGPAEEKIDPECPKNCGCSADCGCGCGDCVLLAWVRWFDKKEPWVVLHRGVRRFVRPTLAGDPIENKHST